MADRLVLRPGKLTFDELRAVHAQARPLDIDSGCWQRVDAAARTIAAVVRADETVYGINTGFGSLARTRISADQVGELQHRLVRSHAAGVGPLLCDDTVRMILTLKINSLAQGHSGVRREVIETLAALLNGGMYPCVPAKGSVGASGDLAPLAHVAAVLIGEGEVRSGGEILPGGDALKRLGLRPLALQAKEGLALLNGTQVSAALLAAGLFATENVFAAALVAGAMSVDAALGSDSPFDSRLHELAGHPGQAAVAQILRALLRDSEIRASHLDCDRVQDPYSLRCQPQIMGACLDNLHHAAAVLARDINAVSDNPLVFPDSGEVLSGGNFHAESVALAADVAALALAETGALSERRIAMLTDPNMSALPAFLVVEPGLNSGFMSAQITAAALASENKALAHPASIDSLPTSANQEDHVSMSAYAARRLAGMAENAAAIVAIELLAAAQGIDMRRPHATAPALQAPLGEIRARVPFLDTDRAMTPDIAAVGKLVADGRFCDLAPFRLTPGG